MTEVQIPIRVGDTVPVSIVRRQAATDEARQLGAQPRERLVRVRAQLALQ